jgi:hypothetical protein
MGQLLGYHLALDVLAELLRCCCAAGFQRNSRGHVLTQASPAPRWPDELVEPDDLRVGQLGHLVPDSFSSPGLHRTRLA